MSTAARHGFSGTLFHRHAAASLRAMKIRNQAFEKWKKLMFTPQNLTSLDRIIERLEHHRRLPTPRGQTQLSSTDAA
jgi:hypothetical protein